ncbi:MAG: hypothetical protein KIS74_09870 [Burkholderiales bacterium]|nr:hypothetical protein [Burkholderiales bacterium]
MPVAVRAIVAFNIVASVVVVFVAYSIGGGFAAPPLPPDRQIVLEPVEAPPPRELPAAPPVARPAFVIPPEFAKPDPIAPRWEFQPDGRVRLLD